MKRMILITSALVFLSSGCEKECRVKPGDYAMSLAPIEGDCPSNIVDPFLQMSDAVTVEEDRECKRFVSPIQTKLSANCMLDMDISAQADEKGLHQGQATVKVTCDEGFTCEHLFAVEFSHTPSAPGAK